MFKPSEEIRIKATFELSKNQKHRKEKIWVACNGEALVSRQELLIYEYLLEQPFLHVEYEKAFHGSDRTSYPDFTVVNSKNGKEYIWEHLGMTNNEEYLDRIPNKLMWFAEQGVHSIENNGTLIITFYRETSFFSDVVKFVELIKKEK